MESLVTFRGEYEELTMGHGTQWICDNKSIWRRCIRNMLASDQGQSDLHELFGDGLSGGLSTPQNKRVHQDSPLQAVS